MVIHKVERDKDVVVPQSLALQLLALANQHKVSIRVVASKDY